MIDERQRTILLVEDEALIAETEKMTLEKYGYNVLTAYTGERAIAIINSIAQIDLILMDIDLGRGIDGTLAAKKILETHDIPLVFLSSHTEPEVVEKTEGISSYGYIVKNSGETILIASIKMAFRLFEARMNEKKKEEAINAEKEFNSLLINSTPAFFVSIDSDLNIMSMNTVMLQTLGYTGDEMIGQNYLAMLVPISEHDMLAEVFNRVLILKQKTFNENKIITKDGRELLCEWYGTPVIKENQVESFIGMGINITERRQNAALRESEELFRSFVHQSQDGIVIIDSQGTIVEWNESEEKITGISRTEALAKPIWEVQYQLLPDGKKKAEFLANARKITLEGLKEGTFLKRVLEDEIQRSDGSIRVMQTILFGIPSDGDILAGAICRDITNQKLAEYENKILLQEKTLLLKEVHHRIKNNIASIESLLSLQSYSVKNPEALSILQDAISRVQSMKILYDNLLISENYFDISVKRYFENLIDKIIDLFPLASNIIIEKNISDFTLNSKILVPIGIIVNELITNALKYAFTDSKQGILQIAISRIEDKISIIIADNGIGVPDNYNKDENIGFGYILVGMLIKQIDGSFSMIRESGTRIIIECPVLEI